LLSDITKGLIFLSNFFSNQAAVSSSL
jgi:hypothetical protein